RFSIRAKELICQYYQEEKQESSLSVEINTTLDDMRASRRDDIQAVTSVHESGHAVLSIVLLQTIPDVIYSITTDSDNHGFVYSNYAWDYISRKEVIPRVAMYLGGYVAEELIFGKENLTSGAASDIEKATAFLSAMYKYSGMGSTPILYSIPIKEENESYHKVDDVENEIKTAIEETLSLAESILKREKKLLLTLSDFLSDNRMLKKNEIKRIANETMSSNIDYIENGDHLFYRDHLKNQIKNSKTLKPSFKHFENAISLNRMKDE
nr:hypothetical protein [Bacteroidales bacterium]